MNQVKTMYSLDKMCAHNCWGNNTRTGTEYNSQHPLMNNSLPYIIYLGHFQDTYGQVGMEPYIPMHRQKTAQMLDTQFVFHLSSMSLQYKEYKKMQLHLVSMFR